jgi:DNA-binding HxlR family transcriptional regulator
MPAKDSRRRSDCPISYALDMFGDKWSLLIVRDMLFKQRRRFGQFAEAEEGISTNSLADRLARLEAEGLVTREPDPENGRQLVYSLTPKGLDLAPVLVEMIVWSARYDERTAADPAFVRKARTARDALIRDVKLKATK